MWPHRADRRPSRPRFSPSFVKHQPHFAGFTVGKIIKWVPTLGFWGIGAAAAGSLVSFLPPPSGPSADGRACA